MPILSVLDQSPIPSGGTPAQAIHETLELAQACDRLGYHGYWLAEPFSFAHFINGDGGVEVTGAYGQAFRPSPELAAPRSSLAVFALCADTEAEALRLARRRDLFIARLHTGRTGPFPSVQEAEAYAYTAHELAIVRQARRRTVAGAPEQVPARLLELGAEYGVDELVVVTITHDFKARLRSYELLAEAFALGGASTRQRTP